MNRGAVVLGQVYSAQGIEHKLTGSRSELPSSFSLAIYSRACRDVSASWITTSWGI